MDLSAQEKTAIVNLIAIAWGTRNVSSLEEGVFLEGIKTKMNDGIELPPGGPFVEHAHGNGTAGAPEIANPETVPLRSGMAPLKT